ncbi:MAG TPA: hypothetical protein VGC27_00535, partial [Rhizomicrobium sp.]
GNGSGVNRGRRGLFLTPRALRPLEFARCAEFEIIDREVVAVALDAFTVCEIVVRQLRFNDQLIALQNVSGDGLTARTERRKLDSQLTLFRFAAAFVATGVLVGNQCEFRHLRITVIRKHWGGSNTACKKILFMICTPESVNETEGDLR